MRAIEVANAVIREMELRMKRGGALLPAPDPEQLKVGVDLGTSNIVITVLDAVNRPVAGAMEAANAVRDGIVVDYISAVNILRRLKENIEADLNVELKEAATAIPPGIIEGNVKVIKNVVEAAGFEVINIVDEPVAAARVLGIEDGAVVDIGGGTTGISVLKEGRVVCSDDEPTGGTQCTLVVAGNLNLEFEEAERYKVNPENYDRVFPMIRPVIEKMAEITLRRIRNYDVEQIYLVGGASCLKGIEDVFSKYTGVPVVKPENPLLVTPIGIAMCAEKGGK